MSVFAGRAVFPATFADPHGNGRAGLTIAVYRRLTYTDGVTVLGSTRLESATATFTSADEGKSIAAENFPSGATIETYVSATEVDLSVEATAGGTGASFIIAGRQRSADLATVYTDRLKSETTSNPYVADVDGNTFPYVDPGDYDAVTIHGVVPFSAAPDHEDVETVVAGLPAHLVDAVDAHDASAISFAPTGALAATTVQAALAELDAEKEPSIPPGTYVNKPSSISAGEVPVWDAENSTFIAGTSGAPGLPLNLSGLTGAIGPARFAGGTPGGAPTTGDFLAGDFVIDVTGKVYVCIAAGTPGTWIAADRSLMAARTTDKSILNSITAVADGQLVLALQANSTYTFKTVLFYDGSTTGDIRCSYSVPSGSTITWGTTPLSTTATSDIGSVRPQVKTTDSGNAGAVGAGTKLLAVHEGIIRTGANAGSLNLLWAQLTIDAAVATTVYTDSFITAKKA